MKTKDKPMSTGVRMAALTAAGNYFIHGRHAGENRIRIRGWALQLKGELLQQMEKLNKINQQSYNALVDKIARRYGRVKRANAYELKHITTELKNAWSHIGMTVR